MSGILEYISIISARLISPYLHYLTLPFFLFLSLFTNRHIPSRRSYRVTADRYSGIRSRGYLRTRRRRRIFPDGTQQLPAVTKAAPLEKGLRKASPLLTMLVGTNIYIYKTGVCTNSGNGPTGVTRLAPKTCLSVSYDLIKNVRTCRRLRYRDHG